MRPLILALITLAVFSSCNRTLRGDSFPSEDQGTYLVVEVSDGWECDAVYIDGDVWPYQTGVAGKISPGKHTIACGIPTEHASISFEVTEGTTFHFDYWGP